MRIRGEPVNRLALDRERTGQLRHQPRHPGATGDHEPRCAVFVVRGPDDDAVAVRLPRHDGLVASELRARLFRQPEHRGDAILREEYPRSLLDHADHAGRRPQPRKVASHLRGRQHTVWHIELLGARARAARQHPIRRA